LNKAQRRATLGSVLGVFWKRFVLLALVALVVFAPAPAAGAERERIGVIVTFAGKPTSADLAAVRAAGGRIRHVYGIVPAVAATLPADAISDLAATARVRRVERDGTATALDYRATHDWGIAHIRANLVHVTGNTGSGARVAVVDTGTSCEHLELDANCQYGPTYISGTTSSDDDNGHGTHVGGTIAAELDAAASTGVAGVAPTATVISYKVLDKSGSGSWSGIIAAIDHIWNNGARRADVVNMSLGGQKAPSALEAALNRAYASGIVLVAAAGNSGNCSGKGNKVSYPARYASVIAVAAVGKDNKRACFSSTGPAVELSAPGVSVYSTWPENKATSGSNPQPVCDASICYYKYGSGTSMASPHVAGVAALLFAADVADANGLNGAADEIRNRMNQTADDLGAGGRDSQYGYGLVDAAAATAP
jgi:subtilisin family serine protease